MLNPQSCLTLFLEPRPHWLKSEKFFLNGNLTDFVPPWSWHPKDLSEYHVPLTESLNSKIICIVFYPSVRRKGPFAFQQVTRDGVIAEIGRSFYSGADDLADSCRIRHVPTTTIKVRGIATSVFRLLASCNFFVTKHGFRYSTGISGCVGKAIQCDRTIY